MRTLKEKDLEKLEKLLKKGINIRLSPETGSGESDQITLPLGKCWILGSTYGWNTFEIQEIYLLVGKGKIPYLTNHQKRVVKIKNSQIYV
jgi:hypothetical protein